MISLLQPILTRKYILLCWNTCVLSFLGRGKANDPTPSGVMSCALNQSEPPRFFSKFVFPWTTRIFIGYLTAPVIGREAKFHLFRNPMKFHWTLGAKSHKVSRCSTNLCKVPGTIFQLKNTNTVFFFFRKGKKKLNLSSKIWSSCLTISLSWAFS